MLKDRLINFFKKYRTESVIYILALTCQFIIFVLLLINFEGLASFTMLVGSDSDEYVKLGLNLYKDRVFSVVKSGDIFLPEGLRPPIYPAFIALTYAIYHQFWFVILVQNLITAFVPVMVYKLGFLLWKNKNIAFFGAVLYLFELERLVMFNQVLSDGLFIFFFILSFYFYIKLEKDIKRRKFIILVGFFIALATLTRPVGMIMSVGYIIFLLLRGLYDRLWKRRLVLSIIFVATFFTVCSPWMVRNYKTFGHFNISSAGSFIYFIEYIGRYYDHKLGYRGELSSEMGITEKLIEKFKKDNNIPDDISGHLLIRGVMREFKYGAYYSKEFLNVVESDPLGYAGVTLYRFIPFFSEARYSVIAVQFFHVPEKWGYPYIFFGSRIPWLLMEFFIVFGILFQIFKKGQKRINWKIIYMLLIMFVFAGVSSMNSAASRLRQPINPFIFLFFAYYFYWFVNHKKNLKKF